MYRHSSPFKWRHYAPDVILLCVRWYCRHQLSYRDVEEMMRERGLEVDHSTVFRRVRRYAPEINKRIRPHLKLSIAGCRSRSAWVRTGPTRGIQHFTNRANCAKGLQVAASEIPEQRNRARPSLRQKESASIAVLQEVSHGGAHARRH